MAKLEITLKKEQFDALEESLKQFYTPTQDGGYELEGVGSIQRALAEERSRKVTKPELQAELDELRQFKLEQEQAKAKAAQDDLEAKGKYEEALAATQKAAQDRIAAMETEVARRDASLKAAEWRSFLTKNGIRPEVLDGLDELSKLQERVQLENGENGFQLKLQNGVGDADELVNTVKGWSGKNSWAVPATTQSGGGAPGGTNTGGESDFSKMSTAQKLETAFSS